MGSTWVMETPRLTDADTDTVAPSSSATAERRRRRSGTLPRLSRLFHRLDEFTALSGTAGAVIVLVAVAFVAIAAADFDARSQAIFASVSSGITVIMVFVLQHTQRRSQLATQIKLDELIRAIPQADNRVVHIEASSNDELAHLEGQRLHMHAELRSDATR